MPLFRIQAAIDELLVVLFNVAHMSHFQQIIAAVHLYTNGIEGLHHFSYVSDDSIFTIGKFCKKMMLNDRINAEFHFLRIYQNKLQFGRMLLIKQ